MKGVLSRWLPDGLAARFTVLLACALVTANLLALLVLSLERERWGRESRDSRELERVVALVPVLESIEPNSRAGIARSASTRSARMEISRQPLVTETADNVRSRSLQTRLAEALDPRDVYVVVGTARLPGRRRDDSARSAGDRSIPRPAPELISVSIRLADGGNHPAIGFWLNVSARGEPPLPGKSSELLDNNVFFYVLGLSLVFVLAVGLWFVRRLTRPLALLAEAAQAAGRGDRSARVPEQGAREVRAAAAAFNSMQAQIARFDAERTRTLGAVGHDLRTPITSLRIRAEMLDDEFRDPMVRTLDEMTVMANGLVAFARGNSEDEKLQSVDLNEMLTHVCQERGAHYGPGTHISVRARPVALIRAVGNLIDNAIRYGQVARVSLRQDGSNVVIEVQDDGPGIPEERMPDLFEPFARGEGSRNSETGGAGLGLSIARSIVRAHGGTVELSNRQPTGLRALIRLPMTD